MTTEHKGTGKHEEEEVKMPKSFAVTTTAIEPLRADSMGHAKAIFTVTNTTARPVRGLAKPKPLGDTKREWLSLEGEAERDFAAMGTHQFTVDFDGPVTEPGADSAGGSSPSAPAAGATLARRFNFRLDVASAQNSDEDYAEGPVVTVELSAAPVVESTKFPIWIIFVIVGVLLLVGVVVLIIVLTRGDNGPAPTPSPEPTVSPSPAVSPRRPSGRFQGRWINADPNTSGITRLEVVQTGTQLSVRAFGKCHPSDCDWGTEKGAVVGDSGQVAWDQGFALVKMIITVEGENQLKVVTDTVFNDARPRQHSEYLFNKQL